MGCVWEEEVKVMSGFLAWMTRWIFISSQMTSVGEGRLGGRKMMASVLDTEFKVPVGHLNGSIYQAVEIVRLE